MDGYTFTKGEAEEAVSIMKEAAKWLADKGMPLWEQSELDGLLKTRAREEFIVMHINGESAAALLLSFEDAFFWPDVKKGASGFIHKLAVKRRFAGQKLTRHIIAHAADICREKGIGCIGLDCDANRPALRAFYESLGFSLVELKRLKTQRYGDIDVALYRMDL